jgi:hypothetical protein
LPIVALSDSIRYNASELQRVQTRGIAGMEPETDPVLNRFFEALVKKEACREG